MLSSGGTSFTGNLGKGIPNRAYIFFRHCHLSFTKEMCNVRRGPVKTAGLLGLYTGIGLDRAITLWAVYNWQKFYATVTEWLCQGNTLTR